ncbi:MAG TPA: DUF5818 domain-containing protein [Candidatus Sulfotelmatobacter sp.]|nr:DUF5818 domain-containing protein [Candidatus Sulfotelmatobacter sp.]
MKRWSMILAVLVCCGAMALAQEPARHAPAKTQLFSSDLVSWSYMQQPQAPEQGHPNQQPTPDPTPEMQPSPNPTPSQPGSHTAPPTTESESQTPTAQTFTGIIDKESGNYVLKVSKGTSYKLDNDQQVESYVGRRVQVTGTLDRSINLIHVDKVEPLS